MDRTITKACLCCGKDFTIPQCRDWREKCCSSECKVQHRKNKTAQLKAERTRQCAHCGSDFVVKKSQLDAGSGKHCSHRCATDAGAHAVLFTPEVMRKSADGYRKAWAEGRIKARVGPDNPRWNGGRDLERHREKVREYKRQNPDRVKAWAANRKKGGAKLPGAYVKQLLSAQRGKCAACAKRLGRLFHLDHILPIALGGTGERTNFQILCATCNLKKAAKHPVDFMRGMGRLL